jgi:cytochrome c-type biogenesis protein CcmH
VVAPVYLRLGRLDDAIKARRAALALGGETSERLSGLGEALVAAADGKVTDEAKSVFERAVALDAENIKARYFIGVAAEQGGRPADAAKLWSAMLAGAPADAPWADFIRGEIARVGTPAGMGSGPNPTEQDVAAASDLSAEQRTVMIRGMIERLAERLNRDGSDLDGWLRLVRSYMMLGDQDKARAAASDARRALAGEPDKLRRIEEFVKGLGLEG